MCTNKFLSVLAAGALVVGSLSNFAIAEGHTYYSTSILGHHSYAGTGGDGNWATRQAPPAPAGPSEPPLVPRYVRTSQNTLAFFDSGRATLDASDKAALDQLMRQLSVLTPARGMGRIGYVVAIASDGHTDAQGSTAANERLGLRRANAVKDYLQTQGIPEGLIQVQSLGESQPVADNRSSDGRARNRRAEVAVHIIQVP